MAEIFVLDVEGKGIGLGIVNITAEGIILLLEGRDPGQVLDHVHLEDQDPFLGQNPSVDPGQVLDLIHLEKSQDPEVVVPFQSPTLDLGLLRDPGLL